MGADAHSGPHPEPLELARHPVVVVDVPAGHGRGELLRTLAHSDGRDVVALGPVTDATDPGALLDELRSAASTPGLVVVVDDVHRAGSSAVAALGDLCRSLPEDVRLLIGGSGLAELGLGELLVDGRAALLGPDELPFRAQGDVLAMVLHEAWRRDVDEPVRRLVDAVLTTGVTRRDVLTRVAEELGDRRDLERLATLPLIEVGHHHVSVDPRWGDVAVVGDEHRRRTASALARAVATEESPDDTALVVAGSSAILALDADALRLVVRAALRSHPPRVGAHTLRTWRESGVLPDDDPHRAWLDGVAAALQGAQLARAASCLEVARAAFAAGDDVDAEIDVGLALGIVARRTADLTTLVELVARSHELEARGATRAANTRLLGEALLHQMSGDPDAALEVLAGVPADAFEGDWAAQVLMMRGTNLLLSGRRDEAVAQLETATGAGSAWSYATALALLATARWTNGEGDRAVEDLAVADQHARRIGAVAAADLARASRAAMLAALGDPTAGTAIADAATGDHLDDEGRRLLEVARALAAAGDGDTAAARRIVEPLRPPERATLSTFWTVALQTALATPAADRWNEVVGRHRALQPAREAGRAAARHLAGADPAPAEAARYLPASWCRPGDELVEVELLGAATVRRGRQAIEHRSWHRGRVRELCLHLALVDDCSRELTAGRLWPDLAPDAAGRNLRVTLSHLLDVLDPDRPRGSGSDLVDESQGVLRFASSERLRIDVRRAAVAARTVVDAAAAGDGRKLLAGARALAREPAGQFLAGAPIGEWIEPLARARADLFLRAATVAAPAALAEGDPDLAEELVRRGLALDPWAERLHQLLVRSLLARDDLDGARRAWRDAVEQLDELGVAPEPGTVRLGTELGLT